MNDIKAIKILENINEGYIDFNYRKDSIEAICELKELQATIEAQEIIIRDKTAFMEAMAQPKTCDGCAYYTTRFTPNGEVSYKFCLKEVNKASDKFMCIWHKPKVQP